MAGAAAAAAAQRVAVPELHHVQQVGRDVAAIGAAEGGFVAEEHGFESQEQGLVRDTDFKQGVGDPGPRTHVALVFKGIAFEHGEDVVDGEHGFREVDAGGEGADLFDDGFVRERLAAFQDLLVGVFEEVLPIGTDVGRVAVIGGLVDE